MFLVPWNTIFPPPAPKPDVPAQQRSQIYYYLSYASPRLVDDLTLIEQTNSTNGIYYTGELSSELEAILGDVVDAYNADPSTTAPVTLEEVHYGLTDGIVEATADGTWDSSFMRFLRWTNSIAQLVYNKDLFRGDESIMHAAGDPVVSIKIKNYDFINGRESAPSDFQFAWE